MVAMTGRPESINAVTLGVTDMVAAYGFYDALGFQAAYGGPEAEFTSFAVGPTFLNLQLVGDVEVEWGRFIVHVDDVDAMHERALAAGLSPSTAPSDAPWGERYFHIDDPDGHEVSFARRLD
jgi:catechol 2,3-dioxygenase-like lactoylglutathione lyase family enzyme